MAAQHETYSGARLLDLRSETISQGFGFVGEVVRVQLEFAGGASLPKSVVVKFAADGGLHELVELDHVFASEKLFYSEYQAESPMHGPACYYVHYDQDERRFVLVLEDLGHCEGGDQVAGTTDERITLSVVELARQHAYWWNDPRLRQIPRTAPEIDFDLVLNY